MKTVRYIPVEYPAFDTEGMQLFLEKKALEGWQLEKIGAWFWKFIASEPRQTRYSIVYLPKASAYDPLRGGAAEELGELCSASGWEHVINEGKLQIFRTDDENAVAVETDERIRLENIRRGTLRTSVLSMSVLLFLLLLNNRGIIADPINTFSSFTGMSTAMFCVLFIVCTAYIMISLCLWCRRSARCVEEGGRCMPTSRFTYGYRSINALLLVSSLLLILSLAGEKSAYALIFIVLFLVLIGLVRRLTEYLRSIGFSRVRNILVTLIVSVIGTAMLTGGAVALMVSEDSGSNVDNIRDMPLLIQDLRDAEEDDYLYNLNTQQTFLLKLCRGEQMERDEADTDIWMLDYQIIDVKAEWLYERCMKQLMKEGNGLQEFLPLDADEIGCFRELDGGEAVGGVSAEGLKAEHIYRFYGFEEPDDIYLMCYPKRIIRLILPLEDGLGKEDFRVIEERLCSDI